MSQYWEDRFTSWAKPASESEEQRCENARIAIRKAIGGSSALSSRDVKVISQGSYHNNTNVRQESDVDIGIVCYDTFFHGYPPGTNHETFGNRPAAYHYAEFKNDVEQALSNYFGSGLVHRGNKAFDIEENTYHAEIDVAPFFEHRRYAKDGSYISGVELHPDNGTPEKVINWPDHHHENGKSKNVSTSRRYKALIRILKNLKQDMRDDGINVPDSILGFLIECMLWNVPHDRYGNDSYYEDLRLCLAYLYVDTQEEEKCSEWGEVSELKYLFRPAQKWTRVQANTFILNAWQHVGYK
jgi:hypothetical protein